MFVASGRGALYLLATNLQAFRDAKLSGGAIAGAPLLISPAAGNRLILIDANELATFDDGVEIESSDIAAIEMVDTPTPGASTVVSAFQTGFSVVRIIQYVNWVKLRDDAVGFLELDISGSPA